MHLYFSYSEEPKFSEAVSRPPVSLNNGRGNSWYAERVPSPVSRAEAAIGQTRLQVGKTQNMMTAKAATICRRKSSIDNNGIVGGIPGIGKTHKIRKLIL